MMREGAELAVGFVLLAGVFAYGGYEVGKYQGQTNSLYPTGTFVPVPGASAPDAESGQAPGGQEPVTFTMASVAQHDTPADCWIVISGKIYSVSSYLSLHPGGAARITPYCGRDATQAFATKGGEGTHSSVAQQELTRLYIGSLGQPVTATAGTTQLSSVPKPAATQGAATPNPTPPPTGTTISLALADVATHNTPSDCWLVISNNVYDVTNYLSLHPGGRDRIIPYCGRDATQAFATQGGQGQHSSQAQQDLAAFYLGPVGGTSSASSGSPPPAPSTVTGGGREAEDEWEDD